jgi:hypothetical protein
VNKLWLIGLVAVLASCHGKKLVVASTERMTDTVRFMPIPPEDPNADLMGDTAISGLVPEAPPEEVRMDIYNRLNTLITLETDFSDTAMPNQQRIFTEQSYAVYQAYQPDAKAIETIKAGLSGVEIRVIGGAWCDDTRKHVPHLAKVLDLAGFNQDMFQYHGVDKAKKPLNAYGYASKVAVSKVPLIVVFRNGSEIGRITENPKKSVEADLAQILR